MKAKKIYSERKGAKSIHVVTAEDGRQFIETLGGWYLIDGMPRMAEDEFLAYLEVPKSDRDKWDVIEGPADETLFDDCVEGDIQLKPHPISIICNGRHLTAFLTDAGAVLWLDTDVFAPMAAAEWRYTLRGTDVDRGV